MPLYRLLGGSNKREIHTDMTISLGAPEKVARDALEFKKAGFPAIKVKLGTTMPGRCGQDQSHPGSSGT